MRIHSPKESCLWLKALWDHHRTARMTRPQLLAAQAAKFRRLAAFVFERSPYYRALMRERGIDPARCTPLDFPVLTKEQVIAHFDEMVTDRSLSRAVIAEFLTRSTDPEERLHGRYHVLHTSGTSGTIGYFVFSHEAWIRGASHVVRASPLRLRRRIAYIAATRGHFAGVSLILSGNDGTNRLFYEVRTHDVGQPLPQLIAALNEQQPHAIAGYAAALRVLAEAQERGELRIKPTHVGNGGEPLTPAVRAYLEKVFGVPVQNAYASSEHLYMAMTFPGHEGLWLLEDDLIFELHEDHTCVTNLFNDVLPLIRYRMDDVLVPEESGSSPFPFQRVKEVVGRHEHALTFRNEHGQQDFIHPIVIVELVVSGMHSWQVVLEDDASFRFRVQLEKALTAGQRAETLGAIRRRLDEILAGKEMRNVRFTIEEVDSIPLDPQSGKFRLVVRATAGAETATPAQARSGAEVPA
jgi:phenylacetate-coenzyme A ligase PaaK-like adenylate-forming protein